MTADETGEWFSLRQDLEHDSKSSLLDWTEQEASTMSEAIARTPCSGP